MNPIQIQRFLFGPVIYLFSLIMIWLRIALTLFYVLLGLGAFFIVIFTISEIMEFIEGCLPLKEIENERKEEQKGEKPSFDGGKVIGYAERSLVYLSVLAICVIDQESITQVFNFLSFIIAGKSLYRFPVIREESRYSKSYADWIIAGTFISIGTAFFFSWLLLPNTLLFNLIWGDLCP